MPTGYTTDVGSGKVTDFATFAMQCARAFGALISMRDDPLDKPVPDEFQPSKYNSERLTEARAELSRLQALSVDQQAAEADKAYRESVASWDAHEAKKAATRVRYEAMLAKVDAWHPPTPDHVEMKRFMRQQLTESIRFDCGPAYAPRPTPIPRSQWYEAALDKARRDIDYHSTEASKEIERTRSRTEWVKALRTSLAETKE